MKFETLTYAVSPTDYSVGYALGPQETHSTSPQGADYPARFSGGIAVFLLRLAAYFQGCLASLPSMVWSAQDPLALIDSSLDETSEPLQVVRMNHHLSRRLRWLIRRGRVERSGEMRVATAEDEARCNLTPGQFNEYSIRVYCWSRMRVYGLGLGLRALRLCAISSAVLQGDRLCLGAAMMCSAPISPD